MPISIDIKKDVQEAVIEVITPLLKEIEELKEKMKPNDEKLLTPEEVCNITGKGYSTIDKYVKEGKFPKPVRFGSEKRWKKSEILKFIESLPTK